jgi:flagellar basal body-associated protein FliL
MAEDKKTEQENEPKKGKKAKGGKKKKLPVLIALVLVLAAGGFFGMKASKGGNHEVPAIKLGDDAHVVSLGEFMVNTADGDAFLKATVLVHLADKSSLFGEAGGHGDGPSAEAMAPYVDAVREVLSSQSIARLTSSEGEEKVKREIAARVNDVFAKKNPEDVKKLPKPAGEGEHTSWHSSKGPVLVVYLTELIWEQG